jgi:hypothetical protein
MKNTTDFETAELGVDLGTLDYGDDDDELELLGLFAAPAERPRRFRHYRSRAALDSSAERKKRIARRRRARAALLRELRRMLAGKI